MKQQKPILHARDHLPGGADPLPEALFTGGAPTVPPIDEEVEQEADRTHALGKQAHYWRFREPDYGVDGVTSTPCVLDDPEIGDDLTFSVLFRLYEVTELEPGPNGDSVSIKRVRSLSNADNWANVYCPLGDIDWGKTGGGFSILAWFKFPTLQNWDLINLDPSSDLAAERTFLLLNGDGSLTLNRGGTTFTSAAGVVRAGEWVLIGLAQGGGRIKVYANPGPPEPVPYDAAHGNAFPFARPMMMESWGLENLDYDAATLASRLVANGFRSIAVQLNGTPRAGRTHADYIAKLSSDVDTLQAAGLEVVGWGVVDGTTAADLSATGVTGWMPQIEGPGERDSVIAALGAGTGSGLPKAVVTNYGGLDTAADVAALKAAGISAAAAEVYAADGHPDVTVILAAGQSYGFDLDEVIPMLGTYRNEYPDSYAGLDETVIPNYGLYHAPQTSDAQLQAFGDLNVGTVMLSAAVIDQDDPAIDTIPTCTLLIGSAESNVSHSIAGCFEGHLAEVQFHERGLPASAIRDSYLSGSYGDTGTLPPNEQIPPGSLAANQLAPGPEDTHLVTDGGVVVWAAQTGGGGGADLEYDGDYPADSPYVDGDIVIHDGIAYLCVRPTSAAPTPWPGGSGGAPTAQQHALNFVIDGGGSAITPGVKGDIRIPYACTITEATLLADQSGSIVIDVWRDSYANFPPVDADSITGAAPPTLTGAFKSTDASLPGWTTALAAGDILRFNVDSASGVQRVTLVLALTEV